MQDLIPLGLGMYDLVANHPPPPIEPLLARLASQHAVRTYRRVIDNYLAWIERDLFVATRLAVESYKAELMEFLPPSLVALRLRIVAEFYEEAVKAGLAPSNPAAGIAAPAFTPDPSCIPPAPDIAAQRLQECDRKCQVGRRDFALLKLATMGTLEPEEVPGLVVGDFGLVEREGVLRLHRGPGDRILHIPLEAEAALALDDYLVRREVADDDPLFRLPRLRRSTMDAGPSGAREAGCRRAKRGLRLKCPRPRRLWLTVQGSCARGSEAQSARPQVTLRRSEYSATGLPYL